MRMLAGFAVLVTLMAPGSAADAKGCLKGAAVGAAAGHFAGHHGLLGAAAGCVIGRHEANKRARMHPETDGQSRQIRDSRDRI
jgi:hypothetical protein